PGCAHDIASTSFSLSAIGCNRVPGGFAIFQRDLTRGGWVQQPGGAVRISENSLEQDFVVNDAGVISQWDYSHWVQLPGCAHDIANEGGWVVGCNPSYGGYGIYEAAGSPGAQFTETWVRQPGGAVRIAQGWSGPAGA